MNRRDLVKSVAALPFIGWIEKAIWPKRKKGIKDDDLLSGTVWKAPWPLCHTAIVQFADISKLKEGVALYYLLSKPYEKCGGTGTAMMICHYDSFDEYSGLYTEEQLRAKLSNWTRCPDLELRLWNRKTEMLEWL